MPDSARGQPDPLGRVWQRIGDRLERNGLMPRGRVVIDRLTRDERHALAGLLGRPVSSDRVSLDLTALDARVRDSSTAPGIVGLVEQHLGHLVDRPAAREQRLTEREGVWAAARAALRSTGLDGRPWVEPWLDDVRRAGAIVRLHPTRARALVATSVHVIAQLPVVTGEPPVARGDLASRVGGDAHTLDDGSLLASVVLRAAAAITGEPYGHAPASRRALWRAAGVETDGVSTTVLTLGLLSESGDEWLDRRTAAGWESHLTSRDLRRVRPRPHQGLEAVFVCENPRVLEYAMEAGSGAAMVCTQGQPTVVVTSLLGMLRDAGAELRYHGDFDWPGITIANLLVGTHGCTPWRMGAGDYRDALARLATIVAELPLLGDPAVTATWDAELAAAMRSAGRVVHEELVLDELLVDLVQSRGALS